MLLDLANASLEQSPPLTAQNDLRPAPTSKERAVRRPALLSALKEFVEEDTKPYLDAMCRASPKRAVIFTRPADKVALKP